VADELDPDVQARIRDLCKKISVAHDLDPEIRDELYGHMEDKLLAYLNGEEAVTEDDAFVLVREHFGDPAVLKELLQDVHASRSRQSLARRLAAAAVASLGIQLLLYMVISLSVVAHAALGLSSPPLTPGPVSFLDGIHVASAPELRPVASLFAGCQLFLSPLLLLFVLRRWRRQAEDGRLTWFMRWRPWSLFCAVAVLLVLKSAAPQVGSPHWPLSVSGGSLFFLARFREVSCLLHCIVWLWWCDRAPRRVRTLAYALCAWVIVFMPLQRLFFLPMGSLIVTRLGPVSWPHELGHSTLHGYEPWLKLWWYFGAGKAGRTPYHLYDVLWGWTRTAASGCLVFLLVKHVRQRRGDIPEARRETND